MVRMVDKPNTTPIGQDRETLTFKALLYLNVAIHAQVCRLFCVVYIPLFSLVQLGYPAVTNTFVVNQIIRYSGVFAITNRRPRYNEHFFSVTCDFVIAGCHCSTRVPLQVVYFPVNRPCLSSYMYLENSPKKARALIG